MIQGGEAFIAGAYAFAYSMLLGYGLLLGVRRRRAQAALRARKEDNA